MLNERPGIDQVWPGTLHRAGAKCLEEGGMGRGVIRGVLFQMAEQSLQ